MTLSQIHKRFGAALVIVAHGKRVAGQVGASVPTVIVLRDGSRYYDYALSGGP